jgi:predicted RNase H-like HicB family nuclease
LKEASLQLQFTIEIWQKGEWFLARTPELDFISQGRTLEEAKKNLAEVIRIQFREMKTLGTLEEFLAECGFEIHDEEIIPLKEIVGFEKSTLPVS